MAIREVILYSCGSGIIVDYIELCLRNEVKIHAIINNVHSETIDFECIPVKEYDFLQNQIPFLVPLFSPHNRYSAVQEALALDMTPFELLSDINNNLPFNFNHGKGCFINKGVVIGSNSTIGNYVFINRGACLGHHLVLEDYVSIGPGVVTGGGITIKRGASIGTGAVIIPNIVIGEQAVIGAGAVVTKNVERGTVVFGNPATFIKHNQNVF